MTSPADAPSERKPEPAGQAAPDPEPGLTEAPAPDPPSLREWVRTHDERWLFVVLYLGLAVGLSVFVSLFWLVVVAALHFGLELVRQRHYRANGRSVFLHALWEVKLDVGLVLLALTLVLYIEVVLGILGVQSAARAAAVSRAGARMGTRAAAWERNLRTFLLTVDEMVRIGHAGVMLRRKRREALARAKEEGARAPGPNAPEEKAPAEKAHAGEALTQDAPDPEGAKPERAGEGAPTPEAKEPGVPKPAVEGEAPAAPPGSRAEAPDSGAPSPPAEGAPPLRTRPRPHAWSGTWKLGDRIGVGLVVAGIILIVAAPWLTPHDWGSALVALAEELRPFPGS